MLDHGGRVLGAVRQVRAQPLDQLLDLRLRRHRPVLQRVEPPPGMLERHRKGLSSIGHDSTLLGLANSA